MQRLSFAILALVALAGTAKADVIATDVVVPAGGIGTPTVNGIAAGARYSFFNFGTNDDTVMRVLDTTSTQIALNDDGGPDANSGLTYVSADTGTHTIQISRYSDFSFTGNTGATFTTRLVGCNGATGAESGANNAYLTADPAVYGSAGFAMSGSLTAGDVDFFAFSANAGDIIGAFIDCGFDSVLGLFDASGTQLANNDDGGIGAASAMQYTIATTGTYYFAVSAFADFGFTGDHTRSGDYLLIVAGGSAIPAPGAAAVAALGGLLATRRRRR